MGLVGWWRGARRAPESAAFTGHSVESYVEGLFVNRTQEIADFARLRADRDPGLLVLSGPPGSGKTWMLHRLARSIEPPASALLIEPPSGTWGTIELVVNVADSMVRSGIRMDSTARLQAKYDRAMTKVRNQSDGAFDPWLRSARGVDYVGFDPAASEYISGFFASFLAVDEQRLLLSPEGQFIGALADDLERVSSPSELVILLDDVHAVQGDVSLLRSLLRSLSARFLVVVSTEREHSIMLEGTRVAQKTLAGLEHPELAAAVKLHARQLGIEMSDQEILDVSYFSSGLPLAVKLIVELKAQSPDRSLPMVGPEVERRIATVMMRQVTTRQRSTFQRLAVPRWFDDALLSWLVQQGLAEPAALVAVRDNPVMLKSRNRTSVHPLVRHFIAAQFMDDHQDDYMRVNVACRDFHLARFETSDMLAPRGADTRRTAALEYVHHAFNISENEGMKALASALSRLLELSELDACAALLGEVSVPEISGWNAASLNFFLGDLAYRQSRWADAETQLRQATQDGFEGHPLFATACITLGRLKYSQGDLDQAADWLVKGQSNAQGEGLRGYAEEQLAKIRRMRGDLPSALALHIRAIERSRSCNAQYSLASNLGSYGSTLIMSGKLDEGIAKLAESVSRSENEGYEHFSCTGNRSLAWGLFLRKDYEAALGCARKAKSLAERLGDTYNEAVSDYMLLAIATKRDARLDPTDVEAWEQAISRLSVLGAKVDEGNARLALAEAMLTEFEGEALLTAHIDAARERFAEASFPIGSVWVQIVMAKRELRAGRAEGAVRMAVEAQRMAATMGAGYMESEAKRISEAARAS
ncbi:AAA family ATPase [Terrabacter sp. AAH1]